MRTRRRQLALPVCAVILLAFVASARGTGINIDFYPAGTTFGPPVTMPLTPPLTYKFVDSRAWTEEEKKVVREAIREWDVWICDTTTFVETTGDAWDVSLRWAGGDLFKNYGAGMDYSNALGVWSGKPGEFAVPWDKNTYPLKEIYLNSQYFTKGFGSGTWYVDGDPTTDEAFAGQYDLLTVVKHEFGHFLGITGDWGQQDDPPLGKTADEVMWGVLDTNTRVHPQQSDLDELRTLGYHVVPEPVTMLSALMAIGSLGMYIRRRTRLG